MKRTVFVEGGRTPFLRSQTDFTHYSAFDLGRLAVEGLITKSGLDPAWIDHVWFGNVIQDIHTTNIAREITLAAGLPPDTPATTISMACISSSMAATSAVQAIGSDDISGALVGGVEVMSDIPIRFRKRFRQKLLQSQKYRSAVDYLSFFRGLKPSDLLPEIPSITEFSTGETMGFSCDKMCAKYSIPRDEQDRFALRSHQLAANATQSGHLAAEIFPVCSSLSSQLIRSDNGIRGESSFEKLSSLKPAFAKPYGTVTAGNSSYLTDGASAALLMEETTARALDLRPKARFLAHTYVAQSPEEDLLIGPAKAIPIVLEQTGLSLEDIGVIELHEAFAGQVLTVLHALESEAFAQEVLGREKPIGRIPMEKINTLGGSLSIGHPFGATGVRLITTAANRLQRENARYALIAACAAGGQGHAMILERVD